VILADAGPLVALADRDDQHHGPCLASFRQIREPIGTVWPAVFEAIYLLADRLDHQDFVWQMLERGALQLLPVGLDDIPRIRELMRKYADQPMDLADAALIRVAEREGVRTIFTVDKRDFAVYRIHGRVRPHLIP
jgi:predicted nucleic acid-binding protein